MNSLFIQDFYSKKTIDLINEENNSIFKEEKNILILSKNKTKTKLVYDQFLHDLSSYNMKMSEDPCKSAVNILLNRKLIFLGRNSFKNSQDIIGTIIVKNNKLCGVVLDVVESEIDISTGLTSSIDQSYYNIYFEFIRSVIICFQKEILKDNNINKLICKYLTNLNLKLIGSEHNLNEKQKLFLEYLIIYFVQRFMFMKDHHLSKEYVANQIKDTKLKKEIEYNLEFIKRYSDMKDIFKAMVDFNVINSSPKVLILKCLTKFKKFKFYALTSSIDYLISLIIISKYPHNFWASVAINSNISSLLENIIKEYYSKMKFDINYLSKK